jgi:hypothetical protein
MRRLQNKFCGHVRTHDLAPASCRRSWRNYAQLVKEKRLANANRFSLAGARGIEPRSLVLETGILTVVLCPFAAFAQVIVTDVGDFKNTARGVFFRCQ